MAEAKKLIPKRRFKEFRNGGEAWEERKLSQLGSIITGSTPSTLIKTYYSNIGIPWVTPTDISDNVTFSAAKHLTEKGQKVARIVPKNTILVTSIASIGKNTILGTTGSFNQQINGLVPNEKENYPYFLFTESTIWSEKMKCTAASGIMQIVNKTEFSEIKTYIPKYKEQEKIGTFFENIDNLITLHQRKLDKIKSMKKAYLYEMFPAVGESKPKRRFKGFTDDWELCKLTQVATLTSSKRIHAEDYVDSGIPFYRGKEITELKDNKVVSELLYITTEKYEEVDRMYGSPQIGDLLITAVGTIGNTWVVDKTPFYFKDGNLIWFKNIKCNPIYLDYVLNSPDGRVKVMNSAIGSNQKALTMVKLNEIEITLPSLKEQEKIGSYFIKLDNLITLHQNKLDKLKNLKKSYLNEMFI